MNSATSLWIAQQDQHRCVHIRQGNPTAAVLAQQHYRFEASERGLMHFAAAHALRHVALANDEASYGRRAQCAVRVARTPMKLCVNASTPPGLESFWIPFGRVSFTYLLRSALRHEANTITRFRVGAQCASGTLMTGIYLIIHAPFAFVFVLLSTELRYIPLFRVS